MNQSYANTKPSALFDIMTFGVELEFIVAYQPAQFANPSNPDSSWLIRVHMARQLHEAGIPVNEPNTAVNYDNWTVGTDGSITAQPQNQLSPEWSGYAFVAIELRSPVLRWSQSAAAFQHLGTVLGILHQDFKLFANESCGFHVHVGNRDLTFPHHTLKKFASLVTVFERQLASIHPYHRINNVHCRAPSCNFESMDLMSNLLTLQSTRSEEELLTRMCSNAEGSNRGFAYNVEGLLDNREPPTIEFRQHEGTLDPSAIAAWVSLACGLLQRCHLMGCEQMSCLLSRGFGDSPYNILDLLVALEMYDVADWYSQTTLYEHPRSESTMVYVGEA